MIVFLVCLIMVMGTMSAAVYAYPGDGGNAMQYVKTVPFIYDDSYEPVEIYATPGSCNSIVYKETTGKIEGLFFKQFAFLAMPKNNWHFSGWKHYYEGVGVNWPFNGKEVSAENPKLDVVLVPYFSTGEDGQILYAYDEESYEGTYYLYAVFKPLITTKVNDAVKFNFDTTAFPEFVGEDSEGNSQFAVEYGAEVPITYTVPEGYVVTSALAYGASINKGVDGKIVLNSVTEPTELIIDARLKQHELKFDGNGAEGTMDSQIFSYGEAQTINEPTEFIREGYSFAGWNTEADGSGTSYTVRSSLTFTPQEDGETSTLYAQWKKATVVGDNSLPEDDNNNNDKSANEGDGNNNNDKSVNEADSDKSEPNTGDTNSLWIWVALLSLSGIIAGTTFKHKKTTNV